MSIRCFTFRAVAVIPAAVTVMLGCGPSAPPQSAGPSYADLVTIYNAELAALDRLEKKREDLINKYEAARRPTGEDALKAIGDLLTSGEDSTDGTDSGEPLDPNVALDRAVEQAQDVHDKAQRLLGTLGSKSPPNQVEPDGQNDPLTEKFNSELRSLDEEIEQQKKRVDQARRARDEAEAALH